MFAGVPQMECWLDPMIYEQYVLSFLLHDYHWLLPNFFKPINLFISLADELFGSITSIRRPGHPIKHIPWTAFTLKSADWDRIRDTHEIIADANAIQHLFSHESQPALWRAIPVFEELQTAWEEKRDSLKYAPYKAALTRALDKIKKYYSKFDEKAVYVLALGKWYIHTYVIEC